VRVHGQLPGVVAFNRLTPLLDASAEFNKIAGKTALGFILMGFVGFFVKLIFIVSSWPLPADVCETSPVLTVAACFACSPSTRSSSAGEGRPHDLQQAPWQQQQQPRQHAWSAASQGCVTSCCSSSSGMAKQPVSEPQLWSLITQQPEAP
jgi:hypothetical protein